MNSKIKTYTLAFLIFLWYGLEAQIKNSKTEIFKISGNCDMCKNTIETGGNRKKVSKVIWNSASKEATITFDTLKSSEDEILKRIALAGYDNDKFLAPDDAYAKLPECCKYERTLKPSHKTESHSAHHMGTHDTKIKENVVPTMTLNPLSEVYDAYFGLKDALVAGNGTTASNKAKELFKAIDKVPMDKLTSAQHTGWMKYMTKLSYDAEHIKGVTETEHQREHFSSLSKNMFEVMKVIKPTYPVYYDHCPMYNDGKGGDWISKESPIKNPFYGSQMLTCGKTVETLK